MKTKRELTKIQRELWSCGLALALLACGESWMVWHFGHDCSAAISAGESQPGVPVANVFFAFN